MLEPTVRLVGAAILTFALTSPAFADDDKKEEAKPEALAGEAISRKENRGKFRACIEKAEDRAARKACKSVRKANRRARAAKMSDAERAYKKMKRAVKKVLRSCREAEDDAGIEKAKAWRKDARRWWKSLKKWAKRGGEAKWDVPAAPEECRPKPEEAAKEEEKKDEAAPAKE